MGGDSREWGHDIAIDNDGNAYIVGETYSTDFPGRTSSTTEYYRDVFVTKVNATGSRAYSTVFGGTGYDYGNFVQQTTDGGYIITGLIWLGIDDGLFDIWLIKTDNAGNKMWDRTFGGPCDDSGWCVQQTTDKGFIITGYNESINPHDNDVWLIKTDKNGNVGPNNPPEAPIIDGPFTGSPNRIYYYNFYAVDPEGDDVGFYIDWGDCSYTITEYVPSGTDKTEGHEWDDFGTFIIKAVAIDSEGNIGPESAFDVTMPRNKQEDCNFQIVERPLCNFLGNLNKKLEVRLCNIIVWVWDMFERYHLLEDILVPYM